MKKIILSLAFVTVSAIGFGQTVESTTEETRTVLVVSKDPTGNDVVDVVSGALIRVPTDSPVKVGEMVAIRVGSNGGGGYMDTFPDPTVTGY